MPPSFLLVIVPRPRTARQRQTVLRVCATAWYSAGVSPTSPGCRGSSRSGPPRRARPDPDAPSSLACHGHAHFTVAVGDEVAAEVDGHRVQGAGEPERRAVVGGHPGA